MSQTILLSFLQQPMVLAADCGIAEKPFVHADRCLDFHVLLYITAGRMHVVEEENDRWLECGDLLLLEAGQRHYGIYPCAERTSWCYIHFALSPPQSPMTDGSRNIQHNSAEEALYKTSDYQEVLPLCKCLHQLPGGSLENHIREVIHQAHSTQNVRFPQMIITMQQLLLECCIQQQEAAPQSLREKKVQQLKDYLDRHTEQPFSSRVIAQQLGFSYNYLETQFRECMGETPHTYYARQRMSRAAALLRETLIPVSEIAYTLGFAEPFYFSSCFKKHFSHSPQRYRALHCHKT